MQIILPDAGGDCGSPLVEGYPIMLGVKITEIADISGLTYSWAATGATPPSGTSPTFTIQLPSPPTTVTVRVKVIDSVGNELNAMKDCTPLSLEQAAAEYLLCKLRHLLKPPWQIFPGDPFCGWSDPAIRGELTSIRDRAAEIVRISSALISLEIPLGGRRRCSNYRPWWRTDCRRVARRRKAHRDAGGSGNTGDGPAWI